MQSINFQNNPLLILQGKIRNVITRSYTKDRKEVFIYEIDVEQPNTRNFITITVPEIGDFKVGDNLNCYVRYQSFVNFQKQPETRFVWVSNLDNLPKSSTKTV